MGDLKPKASSSLIFFPCTGNGAQATINKKMPMTAREAEPIFPGWFPILVPARIALLQAASVM